ncbi:MAG: hypothetical protein J7K96_10935 [Desulfobacteraceae bacterium]|nr:hypothetical protein [Desulfobacteraceae bacterium]
METFFTIHNLTTLGMLTLLQAVLGFDNLLYISIESQRAPVEKQAMVRRLGIGIAVILRIILLFVLMKVISYFKDPVFSLHIKDIIPMSKATFYFVISVLVLTDFVQSRYQKKLTKMKKLNIKS